MATIISSKTTGGGGASITGDTSGILQLASADGTTAVTIDASQNVGIGVTGLSIPLAVAGKVAFGTSYLATYIVNNGATNTISQIGDNATFGAGTNFSIGSTAQYLGFNTVGTERMRIDLSGNVGIGTNTITQLYGGYTQLDINGASGTTLQFQKAGTTYGNIINDVNAMYLQNNTAMVFGVGGSGTGTERMRIDSSGGLILAGSTAQKATGTTWSNPSDIRLKDKVTDYSKGLTELMQVRVKEWVYNGKGGTTEGIKGLGVIADEIMLVLPNTVENYQAKLNADDEADTDIKKFDATEITWLMLNSIQELKAIIDTQQTRITALEAK